jgi:hypothetical protein
MALHDLEQPSDDRERLLDDRRCVHHHRRHQHNPLQPALQFPSIQCHSRCLRRWIFAARVRIFACHRVGGALHPLRFQPVERHPYTSRPTSSSQHASTPPWGPETPQVEGSGERGLVAARAKRGRRRAAAVWKGKPGVEPTGETPGTWRRVGGGGRAGLSPPASPRATSTRVGGGMRSLFAPTGQPARGASKKQPPRVATPRSPP